VKYLVKLSLMLSLFACETKNNYVEFKLISFYPTENGLFTNKVEIFNKSDCEIFIPLYANDTNRVLAISIWFFLCQDKKASGLCNFSDTELYVIKPKAHNTFHLISRVDLTICKNHEFRFEGYIADESGIKVPKIFVIRFVNGKYFWEFDETPTAFSLPMPKKD